MKHIFLITILIFLALNLVYAQQSSISPASPDAWRYFYDMFRPYADVGCMGNATTALGKISNCVRAVTSALKYLAVILFVIALTYTAGLLVFAPFKKDSIETSKKILFWSIIGFIILFVVDQILAAIKWIAEGR